MKARAGFVSNSSSSSFVVIGSGDDCSKSVKWAIEEGGNITFGHHGETDFGWGPDTITDVFSRINFAKLQAIKPEWEEMLDKVIKEVIECDSITWDVDGYIDHQSAACEGENTEIFDDEETLKRFLFCEDSKIELDNDNH